MYFIHTPKWLSRLFRGVLFYGDAYDETGQPLLYLTFDDGPTEHITEGVLDILESFDTSATFFCLGEQVIKAPATAERIKKAGHELGNHGYEHLDAFTTPQAAYLDNIARGAALTSQHLFRPPYGRLTWSLYRKLQKKYTVVLFSIMPGDFRSNVTAADVLKRIKRNARPGGVIVLHDNQKAGNKVLEALPEILTWAQEEGYVFGTLKGS